MELVDTMVANNTSSMESLKDEDLVEIAKATQFGGKVLYQLNEFRKRGTLCDAKLCLNGEEFYVHKVVLASSCSYFHSLFTVNMKERDQEAIELQCPEMFPAIGRIDDFLTFLYTSQVVLTKDNVEALIVIADYFDVSELKELGCRFLQQNLNLSNGIALHGFAGRYHCEPLREVTRDFLVENFNAISQTEEFLSTSAEQLLEIVSSEELVIFSEEELYEGILRWVKHDLDKRLCYFCDLFAKVRLSDVSGQYLAETIARENLVKEDRTCSNLLMETILNCYVKNDAPSSLSVCHASRFLECVFVNGGRGVNGATSASYIYVPSLNRWFEVPAMSTVRYSHGIAAIGDCVVVMGGYSKTSFTAEVERFNLKLRQWSRSLPLQRAMKGMAVAALNDCLYLAGGIVENGVRLSMLLKYNPVTEAWQTKAPMKIARSGACLVAVGDYLYAIGGKAADNRMLSSVERYSLEANTWENMPEMLQKRAYSVATATCNGHILVVGGINEVGEVDTVDHVVVIRTYLRSCEMYSPNVGVWFPVSDLALPRAFAGLAVVGDKIYVFGGEGTGTRYHNSVECYNYMTNTWEVVSSMPVPKKFLQCCKLSLPKGLFRSLTDVSPN